LPIGRQPLAVLFYLMQGFPAVPTFLFAGHRYDEIGPNLAKSPSLGQVDHMVSDVDAWLRIAW
jgi:hypothetical protein